ncbi:ATP-binding cassette domain-containing protein [Mesobacterium pallidum]|uniref:ATP-binding cassette domain-containing protein n=1 Tax=Mesobacterium pallidum TaxID=2872037 RepID=UPI001EE2D8EF|nr:ATP-binding cassette domain-containing protein [Mesobacterium pallidum]
MTTADRSDAAPRGRMARAGALRVLGDLMWPVQAAAVAAVIGGWLAGQGTGLGWLALFLGAGALRAGLSQLSGRIAFAEGQAVVEAERRRLLDLLTLRPGRISSAEVAALLADKISLLAPELTRYRIAMTRVRVVPLVLLALVASQSWAAALVLLVAGPLIPVFMALIGMAAKEASAAQMIEVGAVNQVLIDRIAALPDVRLLGGFDRARAGFEGRVEALRARTMAVLRIAFLSSTVLELFAALGMAMIAVYVGFSLLGEIRFGTWGAPLTAGQGVFVLLLVPEFFQPLRDLAAAWHDRAAAAAVRDEVAALHADQGAPILGRGARGRRGAGAPSLVLCGGVARGIALPGITLSAGQSLAVTGPSGAGKSTLLDVLAGLLPLERGTLAVDGAALDHTTADGWRARLAFVPQVVHVPDVTLGAYLDPLATGVDPAEALAKAEAGGIVAALRDGLGTRLGETGAGVSGGEARRLALARAFVAGADVILADEPTADLDTDTGAKVIAALRRAQKDGAIVIAATHDPALIVALDGAAPMPGGVS